MTNDCKVLLTGEDMYGNQSGMTDIGASCVDIGFMILKCAFVNFSGLKYVKASSFGLSTYSVKETYQLQYNKYNK